MKNRNIFILLVVSVAVVLIVNYVKPLSKILNYIYGCPRVSMTENFGAVFVVSCYGSYDALLSMILGVIFLIILVISIILLIKNKK